MSILITGINGFFGQHVKEALKENGYNIHPMSYQLSSNNLDLRVWKYADAGIKCQDVDTLIHLAAFSGGINFNKEHPDKIFHDNTLIGLNVLKAASENPRIKKVISVISSCAYPSKSVLREEDFWNGLPDDSIRSFGLQKRNIVAYSMALAKKDNKIYRNLVMNNLYGENDSIDINKTKVCMGLIKRMSDAKKDNQPLTLWGDAKNVYRQLTYVKDAAKWLIKAMEAPDLPNLLNIIGDEEEVSIYNLANTIANIMDYVGNISGDTSKPSGQAHKILDGKLCKKWLGELKSTSLYNGLQATINWYHNQTPSTTIE